MAYNPLWKLLGSLLLLALTLPGCGVTGQDIRQELQDERRGTMERGEKSSENHKYQGLTYRDSENWNSTDWSLWMDEQGGGR